MNEEGFKLDISIQQKKIEEMAKQVIREIVESKIQEAMKNIDMEKTIRDKIKTVDTKISQKIETIIKKEIQGFIYSINYNINEEIKKVILEEIQKKPLNGNIYLQVGNVDFD